MSFLLHFSGRASSEEILDQTQPPRALCQNLLLRSTVLPYPWQLSDSVHVLDVLLSKSDEVGLCIMPAQVRGMSHIAHVPPVQVLEDELHILDGPYTTNSHEPEVFIARICDTQARHRPGLELFERQREFPEYLRSL